MKIPRHASILELVRKERVQSQETLRELLAERGFEVAQATLSRDLRELGLVKVPDERGGSVYSVANSATEPTPTLARLLPALYLSSDGVDNLLIVKTLAGGAQPVAVALDHAHWPEVVGTIAGDDSILLVLRQAGQRATVAQRIEEMSGARGREEPPAG